MLSHLRTRPRLSIILVAFAATVVLALLPQTPNQKNDTRTDNPVSQETGDLAEDIIAIFTIVLAGVGCLTYLTFNRQADTMAEQIRLGRDEFIASNRPKLRVRHIVTDAGGPQISVANVGSSPATITGATATYLRRQGSVWFPNRPTQEFKARVKNEPPIIPGGTETFGVSATKVEDTLQRPQYLVGVIKYADEIGIERTTGFCWFYDDAQQAFIHPSMADDPDQEYNYED